MVFLGRHAIFIVIFLLLTKNNALHHEWQRNLITSRNTSEALVEIINGLFVAENSRRVFNFQIKVMERNKNHLPELQSIMDETMKLLNDSITIQMRNGIAIRPDNERHYCVLLVDSAESLEFLYQGLIKFHLFVEGSYFIVLQTFPYVQHYYDELFEIFQLSWLNGITHADVLVQAVNNVILLFHSVPFTPFHCKGVAPIIHNKFIDGHWLHRNFYFSKSRNLYGCPLVCATWEDMPYFQIDPDHTKVKSYMGLEGKLLEYLADKMNFTIIMRWLNEKEINQTVYDEQGIFNKLFSTNTDFVIGAFHYKPTSLQDPYAPTTAYYMSHYYFIVSSKTDPYDPFTKLLLPFEIEIWLILIFIFVFVNVILFTVTYLNRKLQPFVLGHENSAPGYNMFVISLGGAVLKDPKVPFSRFLLMLWLLATFILRTSYQGFLFHFIKSDLHKPPPNLLSDLFVDYRIFMSDVVYIAVSDLPRLFAQAEIFNTSELEAFEKLRQPNMYKPFKIAILTAIEYFGYYKFKTPVNNDFHVVPEKLFTQQLSIYMKKNSAYLKRFNAYIQNFVTEGFMNRWERLLVYGGSSRSKSKEDNSPRPMKISHLYAALRLLFIGLSASVFAFFVEILIFEMKILLRRLRKKCSRRNKKRIQYLD